MGHRGFDIFYLTEVIYLSDRGMWGMLVNIASTTLASFILFGSSFCILALAKLS